MNTPTLQMGKLRLERKVASKVSWLQVGAEEPGTPRALWLPVPDDMPPKKTGAPSIFRSLVCTPRRGPPCALSQPAAAKVPTHWLPANYSFLQIKGLVY